MGPIQQKHKVAYTRYRRAAKSERNSPLKKARPGSPTPVLETFNSSCGRAHARCLSRAPHGH
eukprot:3953691-Pyramimonas_sp.AAC.1